jgi:hypothetical protein
MEENPQTRSGWTKVRKSPVPVTIYFDYIEDPNKKGEFIPNVNGTCVKGAFLHPLTRDEVFDKEAVGVEAFRHFRALGGNKEDSMWRSQRAESCQMVFFSLRVSDEEGAARLLDEDEVGGLPSFEISRLTDIYFDKFVPTKEERKNSLRERLGKGSDQPSTSPNNSIQAG